MGVIALTRALAREYGHMGYRVNALIPGGIETKGVKKLKKEAAMKLNVDLSSYMTGAMIAVDGGFLSA